MAGQRRTDVSRPGWEENRERTGGEMYDVVIIGAGVSGAASARELSRYQLDICEIGRAHV